VLLRFQDMMRLTISIEAGGTTVRTKDTARHLPAATAFPLVHESKGERKNLSKWNQLPAT
jgi:hypothetical protein